MHGAGAGSAAPDYSVLAPLAEDIERHGMSARRAFHILCEGRPGISQDDFNRIMGQYLAARPPEARRLASAKAWALARPVGGCIGESEFERLVGLGRAAAASSGRLVQAAVPRAAVPTGSVVSTYFQLGERKSLRPVEARVERVDGDQMLIVFKSGVRQQISAAWVDRVLEPPKASSEPPSSSSVTAPAATRPSAAPGAGRPLPTQQSRSVQGAVGLQNLGNSCYMNSLLQCLAGTAGVVKYCRTQGALEKDLGGKGAEEVAVAREFVALIAAIWASDARQPGQPYRITRFKDAIAAKEEQFDGMEQQDVQEFAACLLNCLHEQLGRVHGEPRAGGVAGRLEGPVRDGDEEKAAEEHWAHSLRQEASIVSDLFQGQLRSHIQCVRCGLVSRKFETFTCLSLPVVDVAGAPLGSLEQCFREFAREERLSGDERWGCPRCCERVDATKAIALWRLPQVLLVHLKRFRFDAVPTATGGNSPSLLAYRTRKLGHHVEFGLQDLQLGPLGVVASRKAEPEATFDLFAVTYHSGSCGFGHYTSAVRHGLTRRWHLFDDEDVEPLEPGQVTSEKAYLLFFNRRGK